MGWKYWENKKIYLRTKKDSVYTGRITEVDDSNPLLIWIVLIDKYNKTVQLSAEEIVEIKEQVEDGDWEK